MINDLFFDTDCLSAFLWINDTNILEALYGGNIILPDPVYRELSNPRVPQLKKRADALIDKKMASVQAIEADSEEYKLYRSLVRGDKEKIITEAEGNTIWQKMLDRNRKLPAASFSDYLENLK